MKISIDTVLCEGNAVCEALAPQVFEVRDDELAHVLTAEVGEELRDLVHRASEGCPRLAISVAE